MLDWLTEGFTCLSIFTNMQHSVSLVSEKSLRDVQDNYFQSSHFVQNTDQGTWFTHGTVLGSEDWSGWREDYFLHYMNVFISTHQVGRKSDARENYDFGKSSLWYSSVR